MAELFLHDLDDETKRRIQEKAVENGRSQSAEACATLKAVYASNPAGEGSWVTRLREAALEAGGADLDLPEWAPGRAPVDFSGPEYS